MITDQYLKEPQRELKKYIGNLSKRQLEEQITDLYERFKEVKQFYDFAFNPKEDKLLEDSKFKIGKEYFPVNNRKPKMRRSVAQKIIKNFKTLGVEPAIIADVMLYNIEIAQAFADTRYIRQDSFFISMLKSFTEATKYFYDNGLLEIMRPRIEKIIDEVINQDWFNYRGFETVIDDIDSHYYQK